MVKKVKITFEEFGDAYMAYRRVTRSPRNKNTSHQYCIFLGVDDDIENEIYARSEVPEDVAHKIKWLTGPNARTLYKAWSARHGNKKYKANKKDT